MFWLLADWVKSVRESSKEVKIVPRVIFEGWSINDYSMLFASRDKALDVAKTIKHVLLVSTFYSSCMHLCKTLYVCILYTYKFLFCGQLVIREVIILKFHWLNWLVSIGERDTHRRLHLTLAKDDGKF